MGIYDGYYKNQYVVGSYFDNLDEIAGDTRGPDANGNYGHDNNLAHPDWGAAHASFIRTTPASYGGDGSGLVWDLPVQEARGRNADNDANPFLDRVGDMPQPRAITEAVMAQPQVNGVNVDIPSKAGINEYFQFFGQFLTHDVAESELVVAGGGEPPLFLDGLPFPFNRTPFEIKGGVRQQKNDETSYLDLSTVYGSTQAIQDLIRANDTQNGAPVKSARLLTGDGDKNFLPTFAEVADHNGISSAAVIAVLDPLAFGISDSSFAAGDNRVNQQTHLITHHMIWLRNHNWHVDQLERAHPEWSQEELFQAARALNEAEWQNVVFNEYMTKLVGKSAIDRYSGYKTNVDATIINEWTTVAFRFGHDETSNDLRSMDERGVQKDVLTLGEAFLLGADGLKSDPLAPDAGGRARSDAVLNEWIRGQLARVTQEIDGKVVDGNRNLLFGPPPVVPPGTTIDLEVFDIARGRDHGVGRYNALRDGLDLRTYYDFDDFGAANRVDGQTLQALKSLYNTGPDGKIDGIDRLDSIVGGLLEKEKPGSLLGETFTLLNVMQFEALRDGDRFFYLNRFKDNPHLIDMIGSTSLADIIVRNSDIEHVYRDAFAAHERIGGSDGANTVNGTGKSDLVIGFGGNDKLNGRSGDDDLYGDDGNDTARGGKGGDMLWGGNGNDKLYGEGGSDYADGGAGVDEVRGDAGDDFLFGGLGNDKLYGGKNADHLDGGYGNDRHYGGSGRDVYAFGENAGKDTVYDFAKEDRLDLSALEFHTLADVRSAATKSGGSTTIALDDHGATVRLSGVSWSLTSQHVILNDLDFA